MQVAALSGTQPSLSSVSGAGQYGLSNAVYGNPNNVSRMNLDVDGKNLHDHNTLPLAYWDKGTAHRDIVIVSILSEDRWETTKLAPFLLSDELNLVIKTYRFNDAYAEINPYGGPTNVLTKEQSARESRMTQHAVSVVFSNQLTNTAEGMREYEMGLLCVKNSFIKTFRHQIMLAMFVSPVKYGVNDFRPRSHKTMENMLTRYRDRYAVFNKYADGIHGIVSEVLAFAGDNGFSPDLFAIPNGAKALLTERDHRNRDYSEVGPIAVNNIRKGPENMLSYRGVTYEEIAAWQDESSGENHNPSRRMREHGSYYVLYNFLGSANPESYQTDLHCAIKILDASRDRLVKITAYDCLEHCGRFDVHGDLDVNRHLGMINDYENLKAKMGVTAHGDDIDMFIAPVTDQTSDDPTSKYTLAASFGEMSEKHMPWSVIKTVVSHLRGNNIALESKVNIHYTDDLQTVDSLAKAKQHLLHKIEYGMELFQNKDDDSEETKTAKAQKRKDLDIIKNQVQTMTDVKKDYKRLSDDISALMPKAPAPVSALMPKAPEGQHFSISYKTDSRASYTRVDKSSTSTFKDATGKTETRLQTLHNRLNEAANHFTGADVELARKFLSATISKSNIRKMYDNNIDCGLAYILERPRQTYWMSSGFICQSGPDFARTRVRMPHVEWSTDAERETTTLIHRVHSAVDIYREDHLIRLDDIMCNEYVGGEGVQFAKNERSFDHDANSSERADMIVRMVPVSSLDKMSAVHDIGGTWNNLLKLETGVQDHSLTVHSAYYYNFVYKFHEWNMRTGFVKNAYFDQNVRRNTVVWQGHQRMFNSHTGEWSHIIQSQDAMGPQVRDGIVHERCADSNHLSSIKDLPIIQSSI